MGTARALATCAALLIISIATPVLAQPTGDDAPDKPPPGAAEPGTSGETPKPEAAPKGSDPATPDPPSPESPDGATTPTPAPPIPAPTTAPSPTALTSAIELANRGYELFKAGDYDEAIALFEQAEKLSHSPVILSFIAQCYEALGQLVEAKAQYDQIVNEVLGPGAPLDFREAQQRARRLLPQLERRIPKLQLRVSGIPVDSLLVDIDGQALAKAQLQTPISVNPGQHRLVVRPAGLAPVVRDFTATERQISDVELVFGTREVTTVVRERYTDVSWIPATLAFAVGFAASNVSVITTIMHFTRAEDLKAQCPDNRCPPELETERDTISMLGTVSMATFGIAVGSAGVGGLLLLLTGDDEDDDEASKPTTSIRPAVRPWGLGLEGTF